MLFGYQGTRDLKPTQAPPVHKKMLTKFKFEESTVQHTSCSAFTLRTFGHKHGRWGYFDNRFVSFLREKIWLLVYTIVAEKLRYIQ